MKDVRGDRQENVRKWQELPKWVVDWFEPGCTASWVKSLYIFVSEKIGVDRHSIAPTREKIVFPQLIVGY